MKEEQRKRLKKAKEDLEKWLQTSDKINSSTRYRRADQIFKDETIWNAVPEVDRKDIFKDITFYLEKKERVKSKTDTILLVTYDHFFLFEKTFLQEETKSMRKRNIKALADILDSMPTITYRTTWSEARQLLSENSAFTSDKDLLSEPNLKFFSNKISVGISSFNADFFKIWTKKTR